MTLTDFIYTLITNPTTPVDDATLAASISRFQGAPGDYATANVGTTDYPLVHHLIGRGLWRSVLSLQAKAPYNIIDCFDSTGGKLHIPTFMKLLNVERLHDRETIVEICAYIVAVNLLNQTGDLFFDQRVAATRIAHLVDFKYEPPVMPYPAEIAANVKRVGEIGTYVGIHAAKLIRIQAPNALRLLRDLDSSCCDVFVSKIAAPEMYNVRDWDPTFWHNIKAARDALVSTAPGSSPRPDA